MSDAGRIAIESACPDPSGPALPICVCCWASVSIAWIYGFAGPQKATSHNPAMGSRWQLALYHNQLRAAGQKPIVSCRHWRCRARHDELQPREIHLALPPVPAYAACPKELRLMPHSKGFVIFCLGSCEWCELGCGASCSTRQAGSLPAEFGWKPNFPKGRRSALKCGESSHRFRPQTLQAAGCSRRPVGDAFNERYAQRASHSEASTGLSNTVAACKRRR